MDSEFLRATVPFWLMSAGSLTWALSRIRSGRPLVKYSPRRPVPWGGAWLLLATIIFLLVPLEVHVAARRSFSSRLAEREKVEFSNLSEAQMPGYPGYALTMLQAECAGKLIAAALVIVLFFGIVRADSRDLGLSVERFGRKLRIGLIAFFILTPPTLLLQALIIKITDYKYSHPLITGLGDRSNFDILYWSVLTAVFVAPLVEEFFFRGLLQGWLERIFFRFQAMVVTERLRSQQASAPTARLVREPTPDDFRQAKAILVQADGTLLLSELEPSDAPAEPITMAGPSHIPNMLTSLLFGLMHWGHGPAPFVLFFFSLGLGYLYTRTHSLWPSIVVHFLLNAFSMTLLLSGIANP